MEFISIIQIFMSFSLFMVLLVMFAPIPYIIIYRVVWNYFFYFVRAVFFCVCTFFPREGNFFASRGKIIGVFSVVNV